MNVCSVAMARAESRSWSRFWFCSISWSGSWTKSTSWIRFRPMSSLSGLVSVWVL